MTMRKATGLLMRSELAMAVTEVYKEFIEVRSVSRAPLASQLTGLYCTFHRRGAKTLKNADKQNGVWEEAESLSMTSSSCACSKSRRAAGKQISVLRTKSNALASQLLFEPTYESLSSTTTIAHP